MCQLVPVSRAGFYRSLQEQGPVEEEMAVRSAIQQIAVEHRRRYGYRRISAELRRRGMVVNHKRVARIMREDNLLAVQPRQFVVTTDSAHKLEVYLNLASRMKLTGIDQLWIADITYIRLKTEFVYLAVILDGFSRKVVGWSLGRTLASRLAITALEQAIAKRQPPPGLVHHSDRGVQYACEEYIAIHEKQRMNASYGAEYCRSNIEVSLGTYDPDKDGKRHQKKQVPEDPKLTGSAYEQDLVEHGFKWSPVRVYRREMVRGVRGENWRLDLSLHHRASHVSLDDERALLVITVSDPPKTAPVYNEMVVQMTKLGWAATDLRVQPRIRT
jgi:transposase InsO family protein